MTSLAINKLYLVPCEKCVQLDKTMEETKGDGDWKIENVLWVSAEEPGQLNYLGEQVETDYHKPPSPTYVDRLWVEQRSHLVVGIKE